MRVLSSSVTGWVDPAAAFTALCRDRDAVWLDSGANAEAGTSIVATGTRVVTASVADDHVIVDGRSEAGTIFDFLRTELAANRVNGPGSCLGWVGWLGYELRAQTMLIPSIRRSRYPDAAFLFVDRAVVFDHAARAVSLVALGDSWSEDLLAWRDDTMATLQSLPAGGASDAPGTPSTVPAVTWAYSDDEYLEMIRQCQRSIAAGDAYQLCLTTEASIDVRPEPLSTYLALRSTSPTHHGAFFRLGGVALLSSSPEQFMTVSPDGIIETKPIKGTRRRGATPGEDAGLKAELEQSDKERAENLMIVDLMRNDVARVSTVGSVSVPSLLAVESYAHVHQLVSTIRGTLRDGLSAIDAVEACFPAGSMTGAPKRSATDILDRLERRPRGVYSGAFGYFGLDGRVDLAMVIRSILIDAHGATIGTGGGITALSVPEEELDEVYLKAAALLRVLGA